LVRNAAGAASVHATFAIWLIGIGIDRLDESEMHHWILTLRTRPKGKERAMINGESRSNFQFSDRMVCNEARLFSYREGVTVSKLNFGHGQAAVHRLDEVKIHPVFRPDY
jgi:hypothetical protein